jgi:2-polyprenyl-3-methyl-5-hydroxy-6-metoxy-1,4-benzoquinol methylase
MFQLARLAAPEVCAKVPVPRGAALVLDLAGGHGAFSAQLLERSRALSATVLDLPGSNRVARAAWPHPRITWQDGDALQTELPRADVVCCFQLLGHLQAPQRRALLERMRAAVKPGGTLALLDHFANPGKDDSSAFVALNYFLVARTARLTAAEAAEECVAAGWARPKISRIVRLPGQALLVSRG